MAQDVVMNLRCFLFEFQYQDGTLRHHLATFVVVTEADYQLLGLSGVCRELMSKMASIVKCDEVHKAKLTPVLQDEAEAELGPIGMEHCMKFTHP